MAPIHQEDRQPFSLSRHLQRIEDLWQALYYVTWQDRAFALLARLAQDLNRAASRQPPDPHLGRVLAQLEDHLQSCAARSGVPGEPDRQRLTALLAAARAALSGHGSATRNDEPRTRTRHLAVPAPELLLIAPEPYPILTARLEAAGYPVRVVANWPQAEVSLSRPQPPGAVLVDLDFPDEPHAAASWIARLRPPPPAPAPPVLFLAERNDFSARLAAARAGGIAYFAKPCDADQLVSVLRELLLPQTARDYFRVLIVSGQANAAWEIVNDLEEQGVTTQVTEQPLRVLRDIAQFQPDLLLLDLELPGISGAELAQVIAQHPEYATLPMLLQCPSPAAAEALLALEVAGVSLLIQPLSVAHLGWEIRQRLRQARATRVRLAALSAHDPVSGLFNRQCYLRLLEQALDDVGLGLRTLAVLFVMLDNLRPIRDSAGVVAADEVVRQAAGRLRQVLSQNQPAARFTDAIFAVLVPHLSDNALLILARRLQDVLETGAYRVGAQNLLLRVSIGLAVTADRGQDPLLLIQRADAACSQARAAEEPRIVLARSAGRGLATPPTGQQFLEEIQDALTEQRLWLVFQAIASLRGDANERYEALLRLRTRDGQELPPRAVFEAVAQHPLGQALDRWVMAQVIERLSRRQTMTTLFIKILPITVRDRDLHPWLHERLADAGLSGQRLVFEVTSQTAARAARGMFGFLAGIKSLGCGFCLDQFGRNPDSLHLLKSLGADYAKLELHCVEGIAEDAARREQVRALVAGLEAVGAVPIVSGVEDIHTLPVLWSLGVDLIQGFFLQHPYREMSYDFAEAML